MSQEQLDPIDEEVGPEEVSEQVTHGVEPAPKAVLENPEKKDDGRKKPRTEKQLTALKNMRDKREEKQKQTKTKTADEISPNNQMTDLNTMLIYDMEKRRQLQKKDAKWSQMITNKFDSMEERLMELLGGEHEEFKQRYKKNKTSKRSNPESEEEEEEEEIKPVKKKPARDGGTYQVQNPFATSKHDSSGTKPTTYW